MTSPRQQQEAFNDIITAIASNMQPEDVFDEDQLKEWAEKNGYTEEKEEED